MIVTVILNDGSILKGVVVRILEHQIWLDEDRAFGDIVVINKADIKMIREEVNNNDRIEKIFIR